jgi:hypothetical protein
VLDAHDIKENIMNEEMKSFAFVIDGEVAEVVAFAVTLDKYIAIYESNPTIVPVTQENSGNLFGGLLGSTWNGTQFIR